MNYAPVLDVDTNPENPVIGSRSFGRTPELVSELGVALAEGLESVGVAACGKHFPGHGDTQQDSHLELPRLAHSLERLEQVELAPFAAAIAAGIPALMTAHVIFEPLDPVYPATMSRAVLHGLLREKLGYDGLVVSDDLEMRAIADHYRRRRRGRARTRCGRRSVPVLPHRRARRARDRGRGTRRRARGDQP